VVRRWLGLGAALGGGLPAGEISKPEQAEAPPAASLPGALGPPAGPLCVCGQFSNSAQTGAPVIGGKNVRQRQFIKIN